MSGQSGGQRLRLATLNEHLTCKLCGGYFVDATTIIECLHSFCKSCIVKYLESNKFCPVCDAQVHKNKPLLNIKPDQTLQDIVYKSVPGCYQNEMRRRQEFYAKHPEEKSKVTSPEARGEPVESYIYSPDESLSLSLEYYSPKDDNETQISKEAAAKHLPRRYLRCPAAVTVFHLQKLIRAKYGLSEAHRVDIIYEEKPLCDTYTLVDIMYIHHWKRKVPLHLSYRIFESAPKRIKLSDDNDEFKQSLSNSSMEFESKDDDQSVKREWKEVQLKISETGVMSVTDISSLDTKKSTKVNEINQQSSLDQAASNTSNVNNAVLKSEEKEPVKSCTASKNKKGQQETSSKKIETSDEKVNSGSLSAMPTFQNNDSKPKEMEVKSINQRDLSNELLKSANEKCESKCSKALSDLAQAPTSGQKSQEQNAQQVQDKTKTENPSPEKRTETKQNVMNNNIINNEAKTDGSSKQNMKLNDAKTVPSAGSKINALSAKLQFQPKVGQVNNTYSKKSVTVDKKTTSSTPTKLAEVKPTKTSPKADIKPSDSLPSSLPDSKIAIASMPSSSAAYSHNLAGITPLAATYVTAPSTTVDNIATSISLQQQHNNALAAPSTESLASIGLHVSTTMPSQVNLNNWIADRTAAAFKNANAKISTPDQQIRSLPGMPQIGKEIICSTTASGSPISSLGGRFNIQTPSMSIYSITSMKNNVYTSPAHNYTSPSKQTTSKSNFDVTTTMYPGGVPPCPDAIPISLLKPTNTRKDAQSKGTTLNEICAKISNANSGSKINDICAKIGESSKEKSKIEAQRNKPEVPDLLKITKKSPSTPTSDTGSTSISNPMKHIPNIPNVPIYTPSNSQPIPVETKDGAKRMAIAVSQPAIMSPQMQKMPTQKRHLQATYKTLRDPPKTWNPTLSKNNYLAAKNQAKEMQNQQAGYGMADGSGASKQIPSKPAKIFKNRNMPRYLGNPASGVKPMYGVVNDQAKEKDQQVNVAKNSPTMSMMKIDPQTLSPIVSSPNSPIVSPPPYSPTARTSYQNSPFTRDLCRNSNSPINATRNSPVNMFSTNPFIPSHTPNTNPRLIYSHFPPTFADASRFSNPLIRSPIGIPPPSAFLPPKISKLFPHTVQRMPPSSHAVSTSPSAPVAASSSSSQSTSSKSPKIAVSSASPSNTKVENSSINLARSESLTTPSSVASVVDNMALQLAAAKGLVSQQRDLNAFDLTRAESLKSSSDNSSTNKSNDTSTKSKSSPSAHKVGSEPPPQQNEANLAGKVSEADSKGTNSMTTTTKELDMKEKGLAKVNGGITTASGEKSKDSTPQQQSKPENTSENNTTEGSDNSKAAPTQPGSGKTSAAQEVDSKADAKLKAVTQEKQEVIDSGKLGGVMMQGKKTTTEVQKGKAEA